MTRRALLLVPLAARLRADSAQQVWDLFTSMASALSEANAIAFMNAFDPAMPGYEALRASVTALLRAAEVQSSIELVEDEGDDRSRAVELDWLVHIVNRQDGALAARRQERVKCRVEKSGSKWRIADAREAAKRLGEKYRGGLKVLFGSKVCSAWNVGFKPFTIIDTEVVILPHPSGLNRMWGEPGAFDRARAVLREAGAL